MNRENEQGRLTPEAAERVRQHANEELRRLEEASVIEKQLGVRDPELEEIDRQYELLLKLVTPPCLGTFGTNDRRERI